MQRHRPDWDAVLEGDREAWEEAKRAARNGPGVLIATTTGGHPSAPVLDSLVAAALTLRGARVEFLLCDEALPACKMAEVRQMDPSAFHEQGPQGYFCRGCFGYAHRIYAPLDLPIHRLSALVTPAERQEFARRAAKADRAEIPRLSHGGVPLGEHAVAGALRYFATGTLAQDADADGILRRYLEAAYRTRAAAAGLLEDGAHEVVVVTHGIYVPHGVIAETARVLGRRVATWDVGYRNRSFLFSHHETYHRSLMTEPVDAWHDMAWSPGHERDILEYLQSRRLGGRDWIVFHAGGRSIEDPETIRSQLPGFDPGRPYVGLLTNVAWDAQIHYPANVFDTMFDWLKATVDYFGARPDLQLVVRVHPAEVTGGIPSRERVADVLEEIPPNVFVVPPESRISTYALMDGANAAVIYGTKTGVELASMGLPVVVAGEAWIRGKGLTHDATSRQEYFQILDKLPFPGRLDPSVLERARKYAYHFFFRRMIPLNVVEPTGADPAFRVAVTSFADLEPGKSVGLDVICAGILKGEPFVYPAERVGVSGGG